MLESMAARLERLHGGTDGLLVRAVPVKAPGQGKVYGGFVYARLRDASTGDEIAARVPEQLALSLEWNREAVFVGGGSLDLLFLGKFSLEDLPLVEDLAQRGLLVPAKITPRYLTDPAAGDRLRDAARADDLLALVNA